MWLTSRREEGSTDGLMAIVCGLWQKCDYGGDVMTENTRSKGIQHKWQGVWPVACLYQWKLYHVHTDFVWREWGATGDWDYHQHAQILSQNVFPRAFPSDCTYPSFFTFSTTTIIIYSTTDVEITVVNKWNAIKIWSHNINWIPCKNWWRGVPEEKKLDWI